ncbi:MAG: hypothetical protein U0520_00355 [Candidatus Saccharimonadales bacterium]
MDGKNPNYEIIDHRDRPEVSPESIIEQLDSEIEHGTITIVYDSTKDGALLSSRENDIKIEGVEETARIIELKIARAFYGRSTEFSDVADENTRVRTASFKLDDGRIISVYRHYGPGGFTADPISVLVEVSSMPEVASVA